MAIAGPQARTVALKSLLMDRFIDSSELSGFRGGKTGTLWPSSFSLVANSIANNGDQLISVILGSTSAENRYFDYRTIVEIGNVRYDNLNRSVDI
jgi:D-alanyl-D-alanine carboxypeptidase